MQGGIHKVGYSRRNTQGEIHKIHKGYGGMQWRGIECRGIELRGIQWRGIGCSLNFLTSDEHPLKKIKFGLRSDEI